MEVLSQKKISIMLNDGASSAGTFDDRLIFSMTQKSGKKERKMGMSRVVQYNSTVNGSSYKVCKTQETTMGHCDLIINKIVVCLYLQ